MERARGIEPPYEAWEAPILPLNYASPLNASIAQDFISFKNVKSTTFEISLSVKHMQYILNRSLFSPLNFSIKYLRN